jgi:ATP phosphoribosyltransferase
VIKRLLMALPSKGAIAEPTLAFLGECGLRVEKPNPRQYIGAIPALDGLDVLFQRVIDVLYKVADGTAQLGITGLDVVREYPQDAVIVIHDHLNFGHCRLVVAVPEAWLDVRTMLDLMEISLQFHEIKGRRLRVATTYPNQARAFLHQHGIHHFTLVNAEGAIEAAPTIGSADIVVDLVQTGTTLRENHLKPLDDGIIFESQACLIGNRAALQSNEALQHTTRALLERIDATALGRQFSQITANMSAGSAEELGSRIATEPLIRGLQGPTIAPIYGPRSGASAWFTVTIIIRNGDLLTAVERLRSIGASQLSVVPVRYIFMEQSETFAALKRQLDL